MFRRKAMTHIFAVLVSLAWSLHSPAAAGEPAGLKAIPNPRFAPVRSLILQGVQSGHFPSASVAVAKDGEIIWQEALGWAFLIYMFPSIRLLQ